MVVYGDPRFPVSLHNGVAQLRARLPVPSAGLDELRSFLIGCGQLEQGIADAANEAVRHAAEALTDYAAEIFTRAYLGLPEPPDASGSEQLFRALETAPDALLDIKVPEGFAFYALYPEQYAGTADYWARSGNAAVAGSILVAGIRSIGTTLSAVAAATLRAHDMPASRCTVRRLGNPHSRVLGEPLPIGTSKSVLIVDDGPGLSGSSMASVAEAAARGGIASSRIYFMPGHEGMPASQASCDVLKWWKTAPLIVPPSGALEWNGRTLPQLLAGETERLLGEKCIKTHDLGRGKWRQWLWADAKHWPAVPFRFEVPKFLCRTATGRGMFWKFAGLAGTESLAMPETVVAQKRLNHLAEQGWVPKSDGNVRGYIGADWAAAPRLEQRDLTIPLVRELCGYVQAGALPEQPGAESAFARLRSMLEVNCDELLGEAGGRKVRKFAETVEYPAGLPGYGDGRLAPHEWARLPDGELIKFDAAGHQADRSCIGHQSIVWDIAGLAVEWSLPPSVEEIVLEHLSKEGLHITRRALLFYKMAYLAFKTGALQFTLESCDDEPGEEQRLRSAVRGLQKQLRESVIGIE